MDKKSSLTSAILSSETSGKSFTETSSIKNGEMAVSRLSSDGAALTVGNDEGIIDKVGALDGTKDNDGRVEGCNEGEELGLKEGESDGD